MPLDRDTYEASIAALDAQIKQHRTEIERLSKAKQGLEREFEGSDKSGNGSRIRRLGHGEPERLIRLVLAHGISLNPREIVQTILIEQNKEISESTVRATLRKLHNRDVTIRDSDKWSVVRNESNSLSPEQ